MPPPTSNSFAPNDVLRGTLDMLICEWRATDQNRRAKYYELTPAGRRALGTEAESWRRYVEMVDVILRTT